MERFVVGSILKLEYEDDEMFFVVFGKKFELEKMVRMLRFRIKLEVEVEDEIFCKDFEF